MDKAEFKAGLAKFVDDNFPASATPAPTPPTPTPTEPASSQAPVFLHSFEEGADPTLGGFYDIDSAGPDRIQIVPIARHGSKGLKFTTKGNDTNISGSGSSERAELDTKKVQPEKVLGQKGKDVWYAHSFLLPDNFQMGAPGQTDPGFWSLLLQFHSRVGGNGPSFSLSIVNYGGPGPHFMLNLRGGTPFKNVKHHIAPSTFPKRNVWYDWVHHVRWSDEHASGLWEAWMREASAPKYEKVLTHLGANMYPNETTYLKFGTYHSNTGKESSVIHDRIGLGLSAGSVAMAPLGS